MQVMSQTTRFMDRMVYDMVATSLKDLRTEQNSKNTIGTATKTPTRTHIKTSVFQSYRLTIADVQE